MISGRYISSIVGLMISILMLPAMEDLLKVVMIIFVIVVSVATNLFFFWGALKKNLIHELYPDILLQLYKSDDYVQYLMDKRKKK